MSRRTITITIGEDEGADLIFLVKINAMFLFLGAYKGQNYGKNCRISKTRIRKEANRNCIIHTHLLKKKKRRSEGRFYPVIYFERQ
jgi:hypothetical protein